MWCVHWRESVLLVFLVSGRCKLMRTVEVCRWEGPVVLAAIDGGDRGWLFLDAIEEKASWVLRREGQLSSSRSCLFGVSHGACRIRRATAAWILSSCSASSSRYYRKRGSASYIVREVLSVWEREREREIQTERERERERDGSDVTIVALKLAMNSHFPLPKIRNWRWAYTFPCQKFALLVSPSHFPSLPSQRG